MVPLWSIPRSSSFSSTCQTLMPRNKSQFIQVMQHRFVGRWKCQGNTTLAPGTPWPVSTCWVVGIEKHHSYGAYRCLQLPQLLGQKSDFWSLTCENSRKFDNIRQLGIQLCVDSDYWGACVSVVRSLGVFFNHCTLNIR